MYSGRDCIIGKSIFFLRSQTSVVPSFREIAVARGWSMEGTENLEDEIFTKRHAKHEAEEKKRKR